ncbi:hypothetical protein J2W40_001446 [Sphingobium xenophagum]|uniref:Glycerophosphoryl diester phosphodiesterase membrane domain-containing protein n=1 Tax=Sphingobium xenophagum TaxID=121428 RepID=A0ABU1WZ82_SPHXE|nr:hypothetical protein [Sphingobium xenophagum]MDR7154631.1 hypothetical protein [Sphingobium xenophagum]
MATMSIGKAWQEAVAFVAREATLLFPVALLFVALPMVFLQEVTPPELVAWSNAPKGPMPPIPLSYWVALSLTVLISWFGSLAQLALALRPGISVAEALRLSLMRLPILVGTYLVSGVAGMLVMMVVSIPLLFVSPIFGPLVAVTTVAAFFWSRLALLNAVVIDEQLGVVASLRRAWMLTRGHFWRLVGFMVVALVLSIVASSAAQVVLGLLGGVIAGVDGARLVGGIASSAVTAAVLVYMLVMLARLYRQATAG